jgi:hypothetical protein
MHPNDDGNEEGLLLEYLCWTLVIVCMGIYLAVSLAGCATYKVDPATGEGTSYGFLRDLTVTTETIVEEREDGTLVTTTKQSIATKSTTADVLLGFDKLLGTATATAEKLKP